MQKLADNEYTGQFGDLKETVTFTVQGLDYYTGSRRVVVVEPPALENLMREEERPAYLYYRLRRDDNPEELSGKKQRFEETKVSLQGGEVSRIDVPAGTNLVLTATASKDLAVRRPRAAQVAQGRHPHHRHAAADARCAHLPHALLEPPFRAELRVPLHRHRRRHRPAPGRHHPVGGLRRRRSASWPPTTSSARCRVVTWSPSWPASPSRARWTTTTA